MSHNKEEEEDVAERGIIEPRDSDVICGRGGSSLRHPGNQTYRRLVNLNKGLYITCLKTEKLKISRSIVAAIREQKGRFIEKDKDGTYYDIGDKKAVEKTSQALREGQPKLRQKIAEMGGGAAGTVALMEAQYGHSGNLLPDQLGLTVDPSFVVKQLTNTTSDVKFGNNHFDWGSGRRAGVDSHRPCPPSVDVLSVPSDHTMLSTFSAIGGSGSLAGLTGGSFMSVGTNSLDSFRQSATGHTYLSGGATFDAGFSQSRPFDINGSIDHMRMESQRSFATSSSDAPMPMSHPRMYAQHLPSYAPLSSVPPHESTMPPPQRKGPPDTHVPYKNYQYQPNTRQRREEFAAMRRTEPPTDRDTTAELPSVGRFPTSFQIESQRSVLSQLSVEDKEEVAVTQQRVKVESVKLVDRGEKSYRHLDPGSGHSIMSGLSNLSMFDAEKDRKADEIIAKGSGRGQLNHRKLDGIQSAHSMALGISDQYSLFSSFTRKNRDESTRTMSDVSGIDFDGHEDSEDDGFTTDIPLRPAVQQKPPSYAFY